jgi:hypothetical protein
VDDRELLQWSTSWKKGKMINAARYFQTLNKLRRFCRILTMVC